MSFTEYTALQHRLTLSTNYEPKVSSKKDSTEEGRYNLLSCLSCAQRCHVDFMGITWMRAQGTLGRGGQAVVAQTRASTDIVFAFKRYRLPERNKKFSLYFGYNKKKDHAFREICSEIMTLGHEAIRPHPHIIQLMALCWEIVDASWPQQKTKTIMPVLILEKAPHGDLGQYLRSETGKKTDKKTRMRMCAGVASALAAIHQIGIIHGDIKPENSLVFDGQLVKLSDFGFSALVSNKSFHGAGTRPWSAPEVGRFSQKDLDAIKLTDMFSFGMLCVWVIFREELASMGKTMLPILADPEKADLKLLERCNTLNKPTDTMQNLAERLVIKLPEDGHKKPLKELLAKLLSVEPRSRSNAKETWKDFELITQTLRGDGSITKNIDTLVAHQNTGRGMQSGPVQTTIPKARDFQMHRSLQSLCQCDIRVRRHIFQCLLSEYESAKDAETKSMAAVQLAFCKKVGFGDMRDDAAAECYRKDGHIDSTSLQRMIDETRTVQNMFNPNLQSISESGISQPIHNETDIRSVKDPMMVQKACEAEIKQIEEALGKTHPAVLNLKWSLSAMMMKSYDPIPNTKLLKQMVNDLQADPNYGPTHRDTLITRAYFSRSLINFMNPQTAEVILKHCQETYNAMVYNKLKDHVVALILCGTMSEILNNLRRSKESMELLDTLTEGISRIFGPEHPNTLFVLIQKVDASVFVGNMAAALASMDYISSKMSKLVDPDVGINLLLRRKQEFSLMMAGRHDDVLSLIEEDQKSLDKMIPPMQLDILMISFNVYMRKSRFDDAVECARKAFRLTKRLPWPPPIKSAVQEGAHYINVSKELAALIGNNGITQGSGDDGDDGDDGETDPNVFPQNPDFITAEVAIVMSLHAQAHALEGTNKHRHAGRLNKEANGYLEKLLLAVNMKLKSGSSGSGDCDPRSKAAYKAGEANARSRSAILNATDMGLLPLVEILSALGGHNTISGLHYTKAMEVAKKKGPRLSRVTAILEEHHSLCAIIPPRPSLDASPPFKFQDAVSLVAWMTGSWTGLFLYHSYVLRKEKTGRKTLDIKATAAKARSGIHNDSWDVDLHGTSTDDMGKWLVKGRAYKSGRLVLWLFHEQSSEDAGWEYTGSMNLERRALGGYWGFRGVEREASGGTFVFYKY